jgi:hypothetical protein
VMMVVITRISPIMIGFPRVGVISSPHWLFPSSRLQASCLSAR